MSQEIESDNANLADTVIRVFFDSEINRITEQDIESNQFLQDVVQRLRAGSPTVLPFQPKDQKEYQWFAIARTELGFRQLREGIEAFVGSTWAVNISSRIQLTGTTPIREALRRYSNGLIFRFQGDAKKIGVSLKRMFMAWDTRPDRVLRHVRAPGLVRRSFETALQVGDNQAATEALAELRRSGVLDRRNELFLEIQRLDAFGEWQKILELPDLIDLIKGRRPTTVTDALLRAAYHVHMASFDVENDADGALDSYCSNVAPQFASVLDGIPPLRSTGARIVAAAAACDRRDGSKLVGIRDGLVAEGIKRPIVDRWVAAVQADSKELPESIGDPLAEAERIGRLDKEGGFRLAYGAQDVDAVAQAALLLSFANDIRKIDVVRDVLRFVEGMEEDARARLEGVAWVTRVLTDLRGEAKQSFVETALPETWRVWLERLRSDAEWSKEEALHAARMGAHEWTLAGLLDDRSPAEVAEDILSIPTDRATILSDALPMLIDTLQADQRYPDPALSPLYFAMLEHILYGANPTETDIRLYIDLLPAVLCGRLKTDDYSSAIDGLIETLRTRQAVPLPEIILDALDAVVTASCLDEEARTRLLVYGAESEQRHGHRWSVIERDLRRALGAEVGFIDNTEPSSVADQEEEADENTLQALTGKYMAIYTLIESAGARVANVLRNMVPRIRVETSAALVGDKHLAGMARNADVFVMVTRSAKHAATDFIEAQRGGKPILRPKGKGVGSIMRTLRDYVEAN